MAGDGAETEKRIEETVINILKESDMESMTESKVRAEASKRLGLDLSVSHRKKFVRRVVESFLASPPTDAGGEEAEAEAEEEEKPNQVNEGEGQGEEVEEEEEEEDEEEEDDKPGSGKREYERDDNGDPIICAVCFELHSLVRLLFFNYIFSFGKEENKLQHDNLFI